MTNRKAEALLDRWTTTLEQLDPDSHRATIRRAWAYGAASVLLDFGETRLGNRFTALAAAELQAARREQ